VRLGEVEDVELDVQVDPRRSRRDRPHRPGEPPQLRRPQVRDRRRLEPCTSPTPVAFHDASISTTSVRAYPTAPPPWQVVPV